MFRSQFVKYFASASSKPTRTTVVRSYATGAYPPPPAGQPAPNPKKAQQGDNTLLYTGLGLAALGGVWYLFGGSEDINKKAKRDEEAFKVNSRQVADAAKERAGDAVEQGKAKWNQAGDKTKETYDAARSHVDDAAQEAEARSRGLIDRVEESVDSAKHSTKETLSRARGSTEDLYKDVRDSAERKAEELRAQADRKGEEAKEGWFSWLGWGKSKVEEATPKTDVGTAMRQGRERYEADAEALKRETARRVASAAEDVRRRAEKEA